MRPETATRSDIFYLFGHENVIFIRENSAKIQRMSVATMYRIHRDTNSWNMTTSPCPQNPDMMILLFIPVTTLLRRVAVGMEMNEVLRYWPKLFKFTLKC